jgi:integrase
VITIRWQITQLGWATHLERPKTDASEDQVSLDADTVETLRAHRRTQLRERLAAGSDWTDNGLVFVTTAGRALHPADVTDHFHDLGRQAGLPPIRLHDLRHGAAAIALAAGVDMKTISDTLRHSSIVVTADIYGSILPQLAQDAAEKTAAIIPRKHRATPAA